MPILSQQAKHRRRLSPRGQRAPVQGALPLRRAPQRAARPVEQAQSTEPVAKAADKGRRRIAQAKSGPARPMRPPRPAGPGLAAVRGDRLGRSAKSQPASGAGAYANINPMAGAPVGATHPLTDEPSNVRLASYEAKVKGSFERIPLVLKAIASHRCDTHFAGRAQQLARDELGVDLPSHLLDDAWVTGLDMRRLFAWVVFDAYRKMSDEFFNLDPIGGRDDPDFQQFLLDCGFHLMDITPCADGRLAHAISYVLRLPYGSVRRKSYAGSLFDIENTVEKWIETELRRFREGVPNTADGATRYLKTVVYHFSSIDPSHQGCAAHGSDDQAAMRAGWERLQGFREAIENGFCCGASVDLLLIGMDTDTDAIRVHVPDATGECDLDHWLGARDVYDATARMTRQAARQHLLELVRSHAPQTGGEAPAQGMITLIARLIENNISQIDLVRQIHGGRYQDKGHAERFIGTGIGFEEIQLRNLTYFAYLNTVEEGVADMDIGIKIFNGLNVAHGLPVPVVVRYDYHGSVPGARDRAVGHVDRIASAIISRYQELTAQGLLHVLRVVRNCDAANPMEIVGSTLEPVTAGH